jgi:hypothetical protein
MEEEFIIHNIDSILNTLDISIKNKQPFSLIRFGDGGLKFMYSGLIKDKNSLDNICKKEGIPEDKIISVLQAWSYYAQKADFLDSSEVYFNKTFWQRYKKPGKRIKMSNKTLSLLKNWREIYRSLKINNVNYCNPEINFLSILRLENKRNLFDILKRKKICCITNHKIFLSSFKKIVGRRVDIFKIVGWNENHYDSCFKETIEFIKKEANSYDIFLVGAGELGRIYSGLIKDCGGRSFDIGTVFDFWSSKDYLPERLNCYMFQHPENKMELILTPRGYVYAEYI